MKEQKGFLKFHFTRWYMYLFVVAQLSFEGINSSVYFGIFYRDWFFMIGSIFGLFVGAMIITAIPYYFYRKKFKKSQT